MKDLRPLLSQDKLTFFMEAHNGISAKIVEEAGFQGIWASGLAISTSYGLRDCNEASWTQVLETLSFMTETTQVPILMDADTGFGNYNNFRRLVSQLEKHAVAGACIEDKTFPKRNSFAHDTTHTLEDIQTFCGKIKAAKDGQRNATFSVIARTEALVAGLPLEEALRRGEAYADAGADALVVHSKQTHPEEIFSFMQHWSGKLPILVIPTTYYRTPTHLFQDRGIAGVIWGNHMIRSSIRAMQNLAQEVLRTSSVAGVHSHIAPVNEIFRLTHMEALNIDDKKYL